ncbi:MAG: S41 family peptidase, partial [Pyrinomonadaceae bacterium]|nr:S41 family peptidase [Pyrinomonadaceae bacterium]
MKSARNADSCFSVNEDFRRGVSQGFIVQNRLFIAFTIIFTALSFQVSAQTSRNLQPSRDVFRIEKGVFFDASKPRSSAKSNRNSGSTTVSDIHDDYAEAMRIIAQNHINGDKLDAASITKTAIVGALRTLDPHSNYFTAREFQDLQSDQHSQYFGIGVAIQNFIVNGETSTFVTSTYPNSTAFRANLRYGDKILRVNNIQIKGKTSAEVRQMIRGTRNTIVKLQIERASTLKVETVALKRDAVKSPSIPDAYLLSDNIGYVDLSNGFNYTTGDELDKVLSDLGRQNMRGLILDLRNNPGGLVEQAVRVAEKFLQNGKVILSQNGRNYDKKTWKSDNENALNVPLVILVNENTASASEIVAGALQDHDRATIIGETTFGKGLVQSVLELPNEAGLTLTTARYFTPSGRCIQRDYSNGNLYDYYTRNDFEKSQNKQNVITKKTNFAAKTDNGREVFGGGGITPDVIVKKSDLSLYQIKLLHPLFAFTRELVSGRIAGFEHYRNAQNIQFGKRIGNNDLRVDDKLFQAFVKFTANDKNLT